VIGDVIAPSRSEQTDHRTGRPVTTRGGERDHVIQRHFDGSDTIGPARSPLYGAGRCCRSDVSLWPFSDAARPLARSLACGVVVVVVGWVRWCGLVWLGFGFRRYNTSAIPTSPLHSLGILSPYAPRRDDNTELLYVSVGPSTSTPGLPSEGTVPSSPTGIFFV
jgi:hypothetical protein